MLYHFFACTNYIDGGCAPAMHRFCGCSKGLWKTGSCCTWQMCQCNLLQVGVLGLKCILLHLCIFFNDELTPHFIKIMSYLMSGDLCVNQLSTPFDPTWRKVIHQRVSNSKSTHPSGTNLCSICAIPREDMWEAPPSPHLF